MNNLATNKTKFPWCVEDAYNIEDLGYIALTRNPSDQEIVQTLLDHKLYDGKNQIFIDREYPDLIMIQNTMNGKRMNLRFESFDIKARPMLFSFPKKWKF